EDPELRFADGTVQTGGAQLTNFSLGVIDVVDEDVEVKLLRPAGVGELRWLVLGRVLERQPAATRFRQHHPRVVLGVDRAAEKAFIERRQTLGVLAVDYHRAKL